MSSIAGIHHVTAIASDPQANLNFYAAVLKLRMVKLTVNYDDPTTYHFYFGDEQGRPGTILTFFPWPGAYRGRIGSGQASAIAFTGAKGSLDHWQDRLTSYGVQEIVRYKRFDEDVLSFTDPDGLPLEIVASDESSSADCLSGFHSVSLSEEGYESTARLLTETMGYTLHGNEGNRFRYVSASPGMGTTLDLLCTPDLRRGSLGAGTVHHVAFRSENLEEQKNWRKTFATAGLNVTPILDRTYFRSIYFREPGGVLFEIATDDPGFAVDEAPDQLGKKLVLPAHLEVHRADLENALPKLRLPG